jgi:hypothetical protein
MASCRRFGKLDEPPTTKKVFDSSDMFNNPDMFFAIGYSYRI